MPSDTDRYKDYDIYITQSTTSVKANMCKGDGTPDKTRFNVSQGPRQSLKIFQGGTKYSDYEPPYRSIEQRDWSGGRGLDDLDLDETRFFDSYRCETWKEGVAILGPEEQYATGIRKAAVTVATSDFSADSDWDKGTGWTIASGVASCDGTQIAASDLDQDGLLVVGKKYKIKYSVTAYTAGTITAYAGSSGAGTARTAAGTYNENITCSGSTDLIFKGDADFVGSIDNVYLYALGTQDEYWWEDNADSSGYIDRLELLSGGLGDYDYVSHKFTASASYSPQYVYLATGHESIRDNYVDVHIYSDSAGEPDASLMSTGNQTPKAQERIIRLEFTSPAALVAGTVYHVVVKSSFITGSMDANAYYVLCSNTRAAGNAYYSGDGAVWTNLNKGLFFRLAPDATDVTPFFFRHKEAQYVALSYDDGSDPEVFMNGARGTATSATATTLVDTGKAWTADEWIGSIVILHDGTGADAPQRWRYITDNDATSITVGGWDITPDATTQYAIVQSNKWTEVTGHGMIGRITDVHTHNNVVYFLRGDNDDLYHMYNDVFAAEDNNRGTFMTSAPDSNGKMKLWIARSGYPASIFKADPTFADTGLTPTDLDVDSDSISSVTVTDWDMETTGTAAWTQVGTPTTLGKVTGYPYEGTQCMLVTADASAEGFKQALTTEANTKCRASAMIRVTAGQSYGAKILFDGTEVGSIGITSTNTYVEVSGFGVASGASTEIQVLSDGGATQFRVDNIRVDKVGNLVNVGYERVTGLLPYGPERRCHAITTGGIYREDNGDFYDISPEEMGNVDDDRNGVASLMHDVYLYISFLDGVERYYEGNLDDIGPNRDEGLPSDRRGPIVDMVGYAGRIYAAVNGGASNYSSILLYNGMGWHEVYRTPAVDMEIRKMAIQTIPGQYIDRLWFGEGSDIVWLGIDLNPTTNSNYRYCPCGEIKQATVYGGMRDVEKFYHSVKVVGDNLTPSLPAVYVYGQARTALDSGSGTETGGIIGSFDTSPNESITLGNPFINLYNRVYLQLVFGLKTESPTITPQVKGTVVDLIEHVPVKWQYAWTMYLGDDKVSLSGTKAHTRLETDLDTLKTLADGAKPVTIYTPFSFADGITVKLSGVDWRPLKVNDLGQIESAVVTCTAIDV